MITFVEAKMNQQLNFLYTPLLITSLLLISSLASAIDLQINWSDNSSNESGFAVEKRYVDNENFEQIITLPENSTNYIDSDVIASETYCYRISAFNQVGESFSGESCIEVSDLSDPEPPTDIISVSYQFTAKPVVIEVGEKEFYSFKGKVVYNEWFSDDEIYNVELLANKGRIRYKDSDFFSFRKAGVELENGFASMKFDTENSLSFILQGHGSTQVATLYMKALARGSDASSLIVTVGDKVEKITLPNDNAGQFISIIIEFSNTAPVNITTDSNRRGKLMFAGIVFDKAY
jgi:hypothetical protein